MKNKKGFTLIELLAVIVILAIVALIATPLILEVIEEAREGAFKNTAYGIVEAGEMGYAKDLMDGVADEITFTYSDGVETPSIQGKSLLYKGAKPQNGMVKIDSEGRVALAIYDGTYCAKKEFDNSIVTVTPKTVSDECTLTTEVVDYSDYNATKGVNHPKLESGMTAIKWNGTNWVNVVDPANDTSWYDYSNKQWANAITADGSMWVWIPRYTYKISSGWHTNTTGTVDIQFSMATDDTRDGSITLDTGTTSAAANNKWTSHPAFTFGDKELTGIWVAKFEPTAAEGIANNSTSDNVTTKTISILPNKNAWRYISVDTAFTVSRNMETDNTYGWGISGYGIDTHLMKNSEWGAVAYLAKSAYGKETEEVWINSSNANDLQNAYITGCAGNSESQGDTMNGCENAYNTTNGQKASTTGNVYGVYDMVGGSMETVAAYVDNADGALSTYGNSLYTADAKYKDVYTVGSPDNATNNYELTSNFKGDAMYETSSTYLDSNAWYSDQTQMAVTSGPWIRRGGSVSSGEDAGLFSFNNTDGDTYHYSGFRPVLLVGDGL